MANGMTGIGTVDPKIPKTLQASGKGGTTEKNMESNAVADDRQKLESACKAFESFFLQYMLKEMRNTIPKSGFLGGSSAEDIYTSMMDSQLAQQLADNGGIGIASVFEESLEGRVSSPDDSKKS